MVRAASGFVAVTGAGASANGAGTRFTALATSCCGVALGEGDVAATSVAGVSGAAGAFTAAGTGSVWLTTEESEVIAPVKEKFVGAVASQTVRSRSCTGRPARQLRSAWTDAWEGEVEPLGMPHQGILYAEPQVRIARGAEADAGRSRELATYFVGQVVGRLNEVRPAAEVVEEIVSECAAVLSA